MSAQPQQLGAVEVHVGFLAQLQRNVETFASLFDSARSSEQSREDCIVEGDEQLRLGCPPTFDGNCHRCDVRLQLVYIDFAGRKCRQPAGWQR